jgi:hypothetical protein
VDGPGAWHVGRGTCVRVTERRARSMCAAEVTVGRQLRRRAGTRAAYEPENRLGARSLKPAGKPAWTNSPTPKRHWAPPGRPSRCRRPRSSPPRSPTCPRCGRHRPPPVTWTASGCCARCSVTSPGDRPHAGPTPRRDCAATPARPRSPSPTGCVRAAPRRKRSLWHARSDPG